MTSMLTDGTIVRHRVSTEFWYGTLDSTCLRQLEVYDLHIFQSGIGSLSVSTFPDQTLLQTINQCKRFQQCQDDWQRKITYKKSQKYWTHEILQPLSERKENEILTLILLTFT